MKKITLPGIALILFITSGCAGLCAKNEPLNYQLTYRQWYEMPATRKQTYLEDIIPTLQMQYNGDIPQITESLDELYLSCDNACREQEMVYVLENLTIMYTIK